MRRTRPDYLGNVRLAPYHKVVVLQADHRFNKVEVMSPANASEGHEKTPVTVHYFIDEAGDPVLFGRRKVIVGTQSSRYFLLGKLEIADRNALADALHALRKQLLADPYFNTAPSLKPEEGKTAVILHAKDDLAEVRDRVFHLLAEHDVRFSAVVRDKLRLVEQVQARNQAEPKFAASAVIGVGPAEDAGHAQVRQGILVRHGAALSQERRN